jgi:hypothetical protein
MILLETLWKFLIHKDHSVGGHIDHSYVWHVSVKCNGHAVNLDVYFGLILLWQPDK